MSIFQLRNLISPNLQVAARLISLVFTLGRKIIPFIMEHRYEIYQGWRDGQREVDGLQNPPMEGNGRFTSGPTDKEAKK